MKAYNYLSGYDHNGQTWADRNKMWGRYDKKFKLPPYRKPEPFPVWAGHVVIQCVKITTIAEDYRCLMGIQSTGQSAGGVED